MSRPAYTPSWDGQSRASSAGYSAAHSAGTQNTAATGVTHASVTTAPAVAYGGSGGAARGAGGKMRMMLPSPSRQPSRPPSRAASVAGDFRRSVNIHVLPATVMLLSA